MVIGGDVRGDPLAGEPIVRRHGRPGLRWVIAGVLMLASVMNYVDRQALSILATTIQRDLEISDVEYGWVVQAFLLPYAVMYLLSGRVVDRIGTRVAECLFIVWWSISNMLTGLASGLTSLAASRSLLGVGEPGNYTASAKAVAEWFPPREKGIAVAMYSMGGTIGAALAAPLIAYLTIAHGWRATFVITGMAGLALAALWWVLYRRPARHPWLGEEERRLLLDEGVIGGSGENPEVVSWGRLLRLRPMWVIVAARMLTDPVWYFYLFWFPKYLQEERGYSLAEVGGRLWVVYLAADAGALLGGWLSGRMVARGVPAVRARLGVMGGAAAVMATSALLPWLPGKIAPLLLASLLASAHLAWMTGATTLPLDIFPAARIGSVGGAIGAASALAGFVSTGLVAWLVANLSYAPAFTVMSFLHPLALLTLLALLPMAVRAYRRSDGAAERVVPA